MAATLGEHAPDHRANYHKAKQALRSLLPQSVLNWREARYFGRYGEIEMHLVEFLCRRGQDAIDVGANCGGYVHFMRHHARRVIAFEPLPDFVRVLQAKFPSDVTVEPIALSDDVGEVELHVPVIDGVAVTGCSTISSEASATYPAHQVVRTRMDRLDNVYKGTVGFIKIDVEGHELAVLDGAIETISRSLPRVLIEINEDLSPGGLARAKAFFAKLDYRGYYVHAGKLKDIESYSIAELQHRPDNRDLMAALDERGALDTHVYNFVFLPPGEPDATLRNMRERLARRCH